MLKGEAVMSTRALHKPGVSRREELTCPPGVMLACHSQGYAASKGAGAVTVTV